MKAKLFLASLIAVLSSTLSLQPSSGQQPGTNPAAPALAPAFVPQAKHILTPPAKRQAIPEPVRPFWDVKVQWNLQLDENTRALYRRMADLFTSVKAVPDDRLKFWSAVNTPPWRIHRWLGMVANVEVAEGGYFVTVTAHPKVEHNSSLTFGGLYSEVYFVDHNNRFIYKGSLDPEQMAGKMPSMMNP